MVVRVRPTVAISGIRIEKLVWVVNDMGIKEQRKAKKQKVKDEEMIIQGDTGNGSYEGRRNECFFYAGIPGCCFPVSPSTNTNASTFHVPARILDLKNTPQLCMRVAGQIGPFFYLYRGLPSCSGSAESLQLPA